MSRIWLIPAFLISFSLHACLQPNTKHPKVPAPHSTASWFVNEQGDTIHAVVKPESQWKAELAPQAYYVLREKGTERPFTGKYNDNKKQGVYICAACKLPLFSSDTKFDSGTGWPSFYAPMDKAHVREETDTALGMKRTEVLCHRCGGHLGHVFDDGPRPTGLRYCMNSISLSFEEK